MESIDNLNDWTIIQSESLIEADEVKQEDEQESSSVPTPDLDAAQLESKIQNIDEAEKRKSDSSDFECISEDSDESFILDSSSQASHFSYILEKIAESNFERDGMSSASSSGISVVAEDDLTDFSNLSCSANDHPVDTNRRRAYFHTPNSQANIVLSIILILSVTLVCGMGIGHFLGWTQRFGLHQRHINQLRSLQVQLVECLQEQDNQNGKLIICYEKLSYWKQIFNDVLAENSELNDFIDRNRLPLEDDYVDEKCDEVHTNKDGEYRRLKFHLIHQQLENVETLKMMETIKKQETETLDKIKHLEEENEELKEVLENAEGEANSTDEVAIKQLENENEELKKELNELKITLKMEEDEDNQTIKEIGTLREQIIRLTRENVDLHEMIAKLQFSQPLNEETDRKEESETKEGADSWLESTGWPDLYMNEFVDHLLKIATDKEAAKRELNLLQYNLKIVYQDLSKKANEGLITGKDLMKQIHKELETKIKAFVNTNVNGGTLPTETIHLIGKALSDAMKKLYQIGTDSIDNLFVSERNLPQWEKSLININKKISNVLTVMDQQWSNIWSNIWARTKTSEYDEVNSKVSEEKLNNDVPQGPENSPEYLSHFHAAVEGEEDSPEPKDEKNLIKQRGLKEKVEKKSKKQKNNKAATNSTVQSNDFNQRKISPDNRNTNWMLERGSNRQRSRIEAAEHSDWYFQRPKYKESSPLCSKDKKQIKRKKEINKCKHTGDSTSESEVDRKIRKKRSKYNAEEKREQWHKHHNFEWQDSHFSF